MLHFFGLFGMTKCHVVAGVRSIGDHFWTCDISDNFVFKNRSWESQSYHTNFWLELTHNQVESASEHSSTV